jgi:hypothetical protein
MRELFFLHSPPTLLLFAPLGVTDIRTACLAWQIVHTALLVVGIWGLWRLFCPEGDFKSLWLTALLALALSSTIQTVRYTQVNFLLLLLLLGLWNWRSHWLGGVFLGLAFVIKPVFFLVPLYLLARRHYSAAVGLAATGVVACLASIAAFGPIMFGDYFTANPLAREMPNFLYTELVNQSLLATTLRLSQHDLSIQSPYANLLFWMLALPLAATTAWLVWRLPDQQDDLALALSVVLSLLLFPKTLAHYGVLLLPAILLLWSRREHFPGGVWSVGAILGGVYLAVGAQQAFIGMILVWAGLMGMGYHALKRTFVDENRLAVASSLNEG